MLRERSTKQGVSRGRGARRRGVVFKGGTTKLGQVLLRFVELGVDYVAYMDVLLSSKFEHKMDLHNTKENILSE